MYHRRGRKGSREMSITETKPAESTRTAPAVPAQRTAPPPAAPAVSPYRLVEDTWLIPNLVPAEPGLFLPVNTMVIRGEQPIVVDTGAPIHRDSVLSQVLSLVDPKDIRWIYLSHDD